LYKIKSKKQEDFLFFSYILCSLLNNTFFFLKMSKAFASFIMA